MFSRCKTVCVALMAMAMVAAAGAVSAQDDEALRHARELLRGTALVDTHNDLPWLIREYAGSDIAETSGSLVGTSPADINADLKIGPGTYTSDVRGFARGDISAVADSGFMTFSRDLSLTSLLAEETGRVSVGAAGGCGVYSEFAF